MEKAFSIPATSEKGDRDKFFIDLVHECAPRLFRSALLLAGRREEAEDLVQMTFIAAYKSMDRYRGESKHSTWLHSILVNTFRNMLRKKLRWRKEPFTDVESDYFLKIKDSDGTPADRAQQKELDQAVMKALSALPPKQRTVMVLRCIENMGYSEIAKALGCRKGTVKSRIHSARKKMMEQLSEYGFSSLCKPLSQ